MEATLTMRAGALATSRSSRSWVSRKYPRWFTAKVASMPSSVSVRFLNTVPALFTSTSRRSYRRKTSSARRRTSACRKKSQSSDDTSAPGALARTSSRQRAVFAASRPTRTTFAPCSARLRAASRPMPLVAPVTRTRLPRMSQVSARSRQPGDDPAVLLLGERARRLGAHVALRAAGKRKLRRYLVVRRLRDDDRIQAALHEVERLQLAPERLQELPGLLEPAGALLDRLDALIRVLEQRDVGCHVAPPVLVRAQHTPFEGHGGNAPWIDRPAPSSRRWPSMGLRESASRKTPHGEGGRKCS